MIIINTSQLYFFFCFDFVALVSRVAIRIESWFLLWNARALTHIQIISTLEHYVNSLENMNHRAQSSFQFCIAECISRNWWYSFCMVNVYGRCFRLTSSKKKNNNNRKIVWLAKLSYKNQVLQIFQSKTQIAHCERALRIMKMKQTRLV